MSDELKDKVVVVTGAAGTIGRCFARGIAARGGRAIVADIDFAAAERLSSEIRTDFPGGAEAVHLDITNLASVRELIAGLQRRHGRIDGVVNNAYPRNRNYGRRLEDVTYADFCENVDMHLGGYFLVAQQFCLAFCEMGGGSVVNMSSIYGVIAPRFSVYDGTPMTMPVEYAAIKSAITHLTRYFAQYFKGNGIRVNCICPGGMLGGQPEAFLAAYRNFCSEKGMLEPQDLMGALAFLLSDGARYVTGQTLVVDDGFTL